LGVLWGGVRGVWSSLARIKLSKDTQASTKIQVLGFTFSLCLFISTKS